MKRIFSSILFLAFTLLTGNVALSQTQRILGATQLDLDNNAGAHVFLSNASSSLGINATGAIPNTCALLDLSSTTKGLLVPRMTTALEALICAPTPPEGLIVYNTTTHTLDVYNGTAWGASGWALTGNTGTNPATNFLGTTDNQPLIIKTNGITRATFAGTPGTILTLNGTATTTGGLAIDMATNPVASISRGIFLNITGQAGADVTGIFATTSSSNNSFATSIVGTILYSGTGFGAGIQGTVFASGTAGGEARGGTFTAFGAGGATNANLIGAKVQSQYNSGTTGTITGMDLNSVGGATNGAVTGTNILVVGANAASATGSSISVSGSTTSNTGISLNATGTNSNGINIAANPSLWALNYQGSGLINGGVRILGNSGVSTGVQVSSAGGSVADAFLATATQPAGVLTNGFHAQTDQGTISNGVLVENTAAGTITNGVRVNLAGTGTATNAMRVTNAGSGVMTNGLLVENTGAGSITTGVNISGPSTSINASGLITTSGNLSVSGSSTLGSGSAPILHVYSQVFIFPAFVIPAGGTIAGFMNGSGLTGVAVNDVISFGVDPSILSTNVVLYSGYVSAANSTTIVFYNNSGAPVPVPAGALVRVTVTHF